MKKLLASLAVALCLAALRLVLPGGPAPSAHASIEGLDLRRMLHKADGAVYAEIVARQAFFAPEADGPGLYFTRLTLDGYDLKEGRAIRVDVLHHGGFVDDENGTFNSEAPSADDTAIGTRVIAFYRWIDNLGCGVEGNALYGAHGGIFRAVDGPLGATVLGRGAGFAVSHNVSVGSLQRAVRTLAEEAR